MDKDKIIDFYRNNYQLVLQELDKIKQEVEAYKLLSSLKEDLIKEQNKLIDILNRRIKLNDRSNVNWKSKKIFS